MSKQPPVAPQHLPVLTEVVGQASPSIAPVQAPAVTRTATAELEARIDAAVEQCLRRVLEQIVLDKNGLFRSTLRQEIEKLLKA